MTAIWAVPGLAQPLVVDSFARRPEVLKPGNVTGASFALIGGGIGYAIDGAMGQSLTVGRPRPSPGVRVSVQF